MNNNTTPLEQLRSFLNQLFQFETQDLDFGVYKILHYKRKEIKDFIDNLLTDQVKQQLQTLSAEEAEHIAEQLAELEKDSIIHGWLQAEGEERKTLEKFGKEKISQYQELKGKATEARVSVETENQIYNHLSLFFSRYYDKGDFISKRRFGKNEKYMVPYNGEETHFHWANHDQYYIKSSETFQHFAFKIPTSKGSMAVHFKLTAAQVEQGNVKAEEANYFVLSEKQAELGEEGTTFFFEYRPLTEEEKKNIKGNSKQDALDEQAYDALKAAFGKETALAELWKAAKDEKPLLLKKLHHYTRKNKHDFFIHKNLKAFLERELDFYIKSELISVDDLYVTDSDSHFDRLKHNLKTIKVFKAIADTIIAFVSQLEEFQKKLWEKKKFVLGTEWVISIDRLVEYIGEEAARPILEEVVKNEKQVAEWKELFGEEQVPKDLSMEGLKADLHSWRKLPIDTINFKTQYKIELLSILSEKIDLDHESDGLVMHSDNFHGIKNLKEKFNDKIQAIYIDPPYNTSASEILYKNSYKHSSWASFLYDRVSESKDLFKKEGNLCVAIDDFELRNLEFILETIFDKSNNHATVPIRSNPHGRAVASGFSPNHEYALFYGASELSTVGRIPRDEEKLKRYSEKDDKGIFTTINLRKTGAATTRMDRPKSFYPIYVNKQNGKIRISELLWENDKWISLEPVHDNEIEIYPIDENKLERVWSVGSVRAKKEANIDIFAKWVNNQWQLFRKYRPNQEGALPGTWWDNAKYSATESGTRIVKNIFKSLNDFFTYPKSVYLVLDCLQVQNVNDRSIVLDFFPGSGTTFHAVQLLNRQNKDENKCILIEQGEYIYSVIIPRIKKIAYSFDWKDGKPRDGSMNGLGVFFKYQRLEQYEEALENISFSASEEATQKALQFDQYIPKYFLEFETRDSKTFVNTAAMKDPWNYKLKVWDGFTYDTEQTVDLVETFNYLIGLHMQKCITKELNGRKYQFISGNNNANKKITVVWRSVKDWSLEDYAADAELLKEELKAFPYDLLYLNDQAHLEDYQPIEEVFKNKMLS